MKRFIITIIILLFLSGAGFGGFYFYSYITNKNTAENLLSSYEVNLKTDIGSFVSNYEVRRDDSVIKPFTKQDATVFSTVLYQSSMQYIKGTNNQIVASLNDIIISSSSAVNAQLDGMTTLLTENEANEFANSLACILTADVYKTMLTNENITSDQFKFISSNLDSFLSFLTNTCLEKQANVDLKIDSVSQKLNAMPSIEKEDDDFEIELLYRLKPVVMYLDLFAKAETVQIEDANYSDISSDKELEVASSPKEDAVENLSEKANTILLVPLTDEEVTYLINKIDYLKQFITSNKPSFEGLEIDDCTSVFQIALDELKTKRTLSETTINSLRIIYPTLTANILDKMSGRYLNTSDNIKSLNYFNSEIKNMLQDCQVYRDNTLLLARNIRFGLSNDFWGNEEIIELCLSSTNNILLSNVRSSYLLKSQIRKAKDLIENYTPSIYEDDTYDEHAFSVCENTLKAFCVYKNLEGNVVYSDLEALKDGLIGIASVSNFTSVNRVKQYKTDIEESIEQCVVAIEELSNSKTKKQIKTATAKVNELLNELNSLIGGFDILLIDELVAFDKDILSSNYISANSLSTELEDVAFDFDLILASAEELEKKAFEITTINYDDLLKDLNENIEKKSYLTKKKDKLTAVYNDLSYDVELIQKVKKNIEFLTINDNVDTVIEDIISVKNNLDSIKSSDDVLNRTGLTKMNAILSSLESALSDIDIEKLNFELEKNQREALPLIKEELEPLKSELIKLLDVLNEYFIRELKESINSCDSELLANEQAVNTLFIKYGL